jgi:hypothetical protein
VGMLPGTEKTAVDRALGFLPYETPEMRALELAENAYYGGSDPQLRAVREEANAIRYATTTEPVTVLPGLTFTPEQLASLSQKDRSALAAAWTDAAGFTDDVQAMYAARDELLATNPDLANSMGWWEYAQQYPGGPLAALDATAAVNPNVKRWAEDPENAKLRADNPDDFVEQGVRWLGPIVAGLKESRFDFDPRPGNEGVVGGLDGTVGAWFVEQGAGGNDFQAEKIATVQEEVAGSETIVADLNAFRPGAGDEYVANLQAGSDRPIPYDAYQAGFRGPTSGGWTASWLAWSAANPGGTMEQWAEADYAQWARTRTIEVANELGSGTYVNDDPPVATGEGEAPSTAPTGAVVAIAANKPLYDAEGRFLGVPQPGATLSVVEEYTDASGKKWAVLRAADGQTYTAPTASLLKAA